MNAFTKTLRCSSSYSTTHHHHIHTTGKEREWWQERNIDPLKVASALWRRSRERYAVVRETGLSNSLENHANLDPETSSGTDVDPR